MGLLHCMQFATAGWSLHSSCEPCGAHPSDYGSRPVDYVPCSAAARALCGGEQRHDPSAADCTAAFVADPRHERWQRFHNSSHPALRAIDAWLARRRHDAPPGDHYPRQVHQSWKVETLPHESMQTWAESWRQHNPTFSYKLWTDRENRAFIAQEFPAFLEHFDAYDAPIKRADAVRVFYMYKYGGVYADLDFVCVRSFDALLEAHAPTSDVLLGQLEWHVRRERVTEVPNALLISKPRARFWLHMIREMVRRVNCYQPMHDTGPELLTHVVRMHGAASRVTLLNRSYFYPIDWHDSSKGATVLPREHRLRMDATAFNESYIRALGGPLTHAGTMWTHTWEAGGGLTPPPKPCIPSRPTRACCCDTCRQCLARLKANNCSKVNLAKPLPGC